MKKILFTSMLLAGFNCMAFDTAFQLGKGETKGLKVIGLAEPFKYKLSCYIKIPDFCDLGFISTRSSAIVVRNIINEHYSSVQYNYRTLGFTNKEGGNCNWLDGHVMIEGSSQGQLNGFTINNITNNSDVTIINKPDFNLEFRCSTQL